MLSRYNILTSNKIQNIAYNLFKQYHFITERQKWSYYTNAFQVFYFFYLTDVSKMYDNLW